MNMNGKIKVIIAEDEWMFQHSYKQAINKSAPNIEIVGIADNGAKAFELMKDLKEKNLQPDIAIVDIMMPVMDGFALTELISKNYPETKVIIVSVWDKAEPIKKAMGLGARAFLTDKFDTHEIIKAINLIYNGEPYKAPTDIKIKVLKYDDYNKLLLEEKLKQQEKMNRLDNKVHAVFQNVSEKEVTDKFNTLGDVEIEVMNLWLEGKTAKEISEIRNRADRTVQNQITSIYEKLGIKELSDELEIKEIDALRKFMDYYRHLK